MKNTLWIAFMLFLVVVVANIYFLDKYPFLCPITYQGDYVIRSDGRGEGSFAARRGGGRRMHNGIDLYSDIGTPVLAARSGLVITAKSQKGMGTFVVIRHDTQLTTIYGHLSAMYVRKGQIVRQGDSIGAVGKTGNANYRDILPHLHFEVRKDGIPQDPMEFLE